MSPTTTITTTPATCSYFSTPAGLPDYVPNPRYARHDYPNLPLRLTVLPDPNPDFITHLRARNSSRRAPPIDNDYHINIITSRMEEITLERSAAPAEGGRHSSIYMRIIAEENAVKEAPEANSKATARKRLSLSEPKRRVKRCVRKIRSWELRRGMRKAKARTGTRTSHSAPKPAPATVATRVATPYPSVVQHRACVAQPWLETEVVPTPAPAPAPAPVPVTPVPGKERVWWYEDKERAGVRRSTSAAFVQENERVWWIV